MDNSISEAMIYKNAVDTCREVNRLSSSSEDVDSSTEMVDINRIVNSLTGRIPDETDNVVQPAKYCQHNSHLSAIKPGHL